MRIEWLHKKGSDRVIVFFNGWGMDQAAVSHLSKDCDVVMVYDYRDLKAGNLPNLDTYPKVYVVAWSMGVWAAANLIPEMQREPSIMIAMNGTEHPVHDFWGIPEKIYALTEKGMNEKGREKFLLRMLNGREELQRFTQNHPQRPIKEVCEELCLIGKQSIGYHNELNWNKVYISEKDIIFPVINQQNWWRDKCSHLQMLPGGHYPFYQFQSWDEILEK